MLSGSQEAEESPHALPSVGGSCPSTFLPFRPQLASLRAKAWRGLARAMPQAWSRFRVGPKSLEKAPGAFFPRVEVGFKWWVVGVSASGRPGSAEIPRSGIARRTGKN